MTAVEQVPGLLERLDSLFAHPGWDAVPEAATRDRQDLRDLLMEAGDEVESVLVATGRQPTPPNEEQAALDLSSKEFVRALEGAAMLLNVCGDAVASERARLKLSWGGADAELGQALARAGTAMRKVALHALDVRAGVRIWGIAAG